MLVKEFKQELNKFGDEPQIFIRLKDENDIIVLADFSKIISSNVLGFGFIVPVSKINKENSKNGK